MAEVENDRDIFVKKETVKFPCESGASMDFQQNVSVLNLISRIEDCNAASYMYIYIYTHIHTNKQGGVTSSVLVVKSYNSLCDLTYIHQFVERDFNQTLVLR